MWYKQNNCQMRPQVKFWAHVQYVRRKMINLDGSIMLR